MLLAKYSTIISLILKSLFYPKEMSIRLSFLLILTASMAIPQPLNSFYFEHLNIRNIGAG